MTMFEHQWENVLTSTPNSWMPQNVSQHHLYLVKSFIFVSWSYLVYKMARKHTFLVFSHRFFGHNWENILVSSPNHSCIPQNIFQHDHQYSCWLTTVDFGILLDSMSWTDVSGSLKHLFCFFSGQWLIMIVYLQVLQCVTGQGVKFKP